MKSFATLILSNNKNKHDEIVIVDNNGTNETSFDELRLLVFKVAAYVAEHDFNGIIPVLMDRGVQAVATVLGFNLAGVAVAPLAISTPVERCKNIAAQTGNEIWTIETYNNAMNYECSSECIFAHQNIVNTDFDLIDKEFWAEEPDRAAYVVFTSGSTGIPKGVLLNNRAICCAIVRDSSPEFFDFKNDSKVLQSGSLSFIVFVLDMLSPIYAGCCIYVMPEEFKGSCDKFTEYINKYGITELYMSPQLYRMFEGAPSLRCVYTGSDRIVNLAPKGKAKLKSGYGLSETAGPFLTYDIKEPMSNTPIGKSCEEIQTYILDENNNICDEGELCVSGAILSEYLNMPDNNKESFMPNPFSDDPKFSVLFKTGDIVKKCDDGNLLFVNRIDNMIKINGQRVEPGEIEAAMIKFDGIVLAVVKGFTDDIQHSILCAYYTCNKDIDEEEVKSYLSAKLPHYMIPSVFVKLDKMPVNSNGKLDRKSLAMPDLSKFAEEYAEPVGDKEKLICHGFEKVLGISKVGRNDDFFRIGGDSIAALTLAKECESLHISTTDIFKGKTPKAIAAMIDTNAGIDSKMISHVENRKYYPITENQRGIYVDLEMNKNSTQYNMPIVYKFTDKKPDKLAESVKIVIDAHNGLKTRFELQDNDIVQVANITEMPVVSITRLKTKPDNAFFQNLVKPFDLTKDRLYRIEIYSYDDTVYLFMDIHHIIADGLSMNLLLGDILSVYEGEKPTEEIITAYDYALYEKELLISNKYKQAEDYYAKLLNNASAVSFTQSKQVDNEKSKIIKVQLASQDIDNICAKYGVTASCFFNAAFAQVLKQFTREDNPMYLTVSNGRELDNRLSNCTGMFVKTLPVVLYTPNHEQESVAEYLNSMQSQLYTSIENNFYPYTHMVEKYGLKGQIMFVYQGGVIGDGSKQNSVQSIEVVSDTTKLPVTVLLYPEKGNYTISIEYDGQQFNEIDMKKLADAIMNTALNMTKKTFIKDVSVVSKEEEDIIVQYSAGDKLVYDKSLTWIDMFKNQVKCNSDIVAVVDSVGSLTYAELDKQSDAIAYYLVTNGVKPNDFVAIKMGRVKEFIVAVMGINKAGAAYVPIDPTYPQDRIEYMVKDSDAKIVLTENLVQKILSDDYTNLNNKLQEFTLPSKPENYAYMIYTSGSTGKPKGVVINHKNITACAAWLIELFDLKPGKQNLHHASFSFDASTFDLFYPLAAGATIHILNEELRKDTQAIVEYIKGNHITGMTMSTAMGMILLNQYDFEMEYIMLGGEKFVPVKKTSTRLFNGYGPTEFTVCSSYQEVDQEKEGDIPIGKAVPNTYSFICDTNGNLLPLGMTGEICLVGPQISSGYWNLPEKTKEVFVDCPFMPGEKMYRTGDLARYNENSELEYLGRIDFQVKLRGFRVELGEIENCAIKYNGIKQVNAQVKNEQLVLYYTAADKIDEKDLREFMSQSLAEYMVPGVFMHLDKMPMTPGGKIDIKALPDPQRVSSVKYIEPATKEEIIVADAMQKVIGLQNKVGNLDNFFELGGDSIKAIRMVSLLRSQGLNIKTADIMQLKTVSMIASACNVQENTHCTIQQPFEGSVKDTAIVKFFKYLALPKENHFNQSMLFKLKSQIDINILQEAIDSIIYQHDMLRAIVKDNCLFVRSADTKIRIKEFNLIGKDAGDCNKITNLCNEIQSSININNDLVKPALIHTDKCDYFFMAVHHLVVDGISWRIIAVDLECAYKNLIDGKKINLPDKTSTYNDYAEALEKYRNSYQLEQEIPYWENVQSKLMELPGSDEHDYSRKFDVINVRLDEEETAKLMSAKVSSFNGDVNDVLLTAVCRSYKDTFGQNNLSVQFEGHGREDIGQELFYDRTVGWFTSIYPVIIENICGDIREDLLNVKEVMRSVPNKGVGYNVLRFIEGKTNVNFITEKIAKLGFNYLGKFGDESEDKDAFFNIESNISSGEAISHDNTFGTDLSINCAVTNGIFWLSLNYNTNKCSEQQAQSFIETTMHELEKITEFLSNNDKQMITASDLGEHEWSNEEFANIMASFESRNEKIERIYPITSMQEGMLLKHISDSASWAYRLVSIWEINALLTEDQMSRVIKRLGDKHEVLRSAIIHKGVLKPRQAIVDRKLGLKMLDYSNCENPESEVCEYRKQILTSVFDLQDKPLFQVSCIKKDEKSSYIVVAVHHIIVDGWSLNLYMDDLWKYINEEITGHFSKDVSVNKGIYEAAIREITQKDKNKGLEYWKGLLTDYSNKAEISSKGEIPIDEQSKTDEFGCYIDAEVVSQLMQICNKEQATLNNAIELAWGLVLQAYNNTNDVVFAKVVSGRDNTSIDVNDIVGIFINTIPVRVHTNSNVTVRQMLHELHEQTIASNEYDFCSLSEIQQQSELGSQLFQTVIAFENYNSGLESNNTHNDENNILETTPLILKEENFEEINTSMSVTSDGRLYLHIGFDTKLYSFKDIETIGELFCTLVNSMAEYPDNKVATLNRVNAVSAANIMRVSSGEVIAYDETSTWIDKFKNQVKCNGDLVALVDSMGTLTYAELDKQSDAIAYYLVTNGVKPNDFVAIKMGRVKEFIVAVMGINKAGAAYVPVDPTYPQDRITYMIEDSKAKIVFTESLVQEILSNDSINYSIKTNEIILLPKPENYAYMIYTSGSTGKPKGAIINHKNITACAVWLIKLFDLKPGKQNLHHASFSFDASTFDLFYPLAAGATIHVFAEELRKDTQAIAEYIKNNNITGMTMSTAMGLILLNQYSFDMDYIMLGGEKFMPVKKTSTRLFNGYGPTEFTCVSSCQEVNQEKEGDIPIGKAVSNTYSFICDINGNLLPLGMTGEICLVGPQISSGYWNLPEKTKEVFVDCPFMPGETMYRTGDLARYNEDGELEFLGRKDFQVKLRGFRIELGEIENCAVKYKGIKLVNAQVKNEQLVLYYTAADKIGEKDLREFMSQTLAEYMVPGVFMHLDKMPMTPGGKIDIKALPNPELSLGEVIAPQTNLEKRLFDIVKEQLNVDGFGVTTNLIRIGMSSLSAMKLATAIDKYLTEKVKYADIMKHPNIRELAQIIETGVKEDKIIEHADERGYYPITENQRGIYIDWERNQDTIQYNIPSVYKFTDKDSDKLASAVRDAINAHYTLKTSFTVVDGDIRQFSHSNNSAEVSVITVENEPNTEFFQNRVKPFDLFSDRLYRAEIYVYGKITYLFLDIHHIIYDGLSAQILLNEILLAYDGKTLNPETINAYDFAIYENEKISSRMYDKAEVFFDNMLQNANATSYPDSQNPDGCALGSIEVQIPAGEINDACAQMGITLSSYWQAAFAETLHRLTREDNPIYLTISNGRGVDTELAKCIGMFVKTLPVALHTKDYINKTVTEYARLFHSQLQTCIDNDFYPYTKLVNKHHFKGEIMFIYQGDIQPAHPSDDKEDIQIQLDTVKLPITLLVYLVNKQFSIHVEYDGKRFGKDDMTQLVQAVINMALCMAKKKYLSECSIVTDDQVKQLIKLSYGEKLEYNSAETWLDMFKRQVSTHGNTIAVVDSVSNITYDQLDEKSDMIAHYLSQHGVKINDFVAVKMGRVKEFIVAILGIHKAGAGYVPIDVGYPENRIDYMLKDSGARITLTEALVKEILSVETSEISTFHCLAKPENYAYMIYTSGSTGKPKGVVQSHRSLNAFVSWRINKISLSQNSLHAQHASFSFDASIDDLICPLAAGGQVHIFSEPMRKDMDAMHQYIIDNHITGLTMSTQMGMLMINQYPDMPLEFIMMGGEKMLPCNKTNIKIINGYGPTEFTVCSSFHIVDQNAKGDIPIGRPVPNTYSFICDTKGQLLMQGMSGELCLAGPQISSGYWNLPEKTAEVFVDCPVLPGQTMYRTGDLARYNKNGELEFLGRIDSQVKLRGFRIELGEVENCAAGYEGIKQVCALVNKKQLLLYFTADKEIDKDTLKQFMSQTLTEYMVPDVFMQLSQMPMTPNGKIDRKSLLNVKIVRKDSPKRLPQTALEEKIVELISRILDIKDVYVTDNFFELGGTSLSASQFIMLLKSAGYEVNYQDVFDYQTPLELAAFLSGRQNSMKISSKSSEENMQVDDKSSFSDVLKYNTITYADKVEQLPLGDVLLTGATGFLGIHVLRELLESDAKHIVCLVHSKTQERAIRRLQSYLVYYFSNDYVDAFNDRIIVIAGDILSDELNNILADIKLDTIINCAACVKHYSKDNLIERINVDGVRNLIKVAIEKNAKLIQTSTISVPGAHSDATYQVNLTMKENQLFVIDDLNNQYIQSKYKAEKLVLEAVRDEGLRGKIIRVGNLMGRYSDGEFQINMNENSFMNSIRGFAYLGKFPVSHSTDSMFASPIDYTAKAVVLLAGTNDIFTAFHADSRYGFDQMKIMAALNNNGIVVKPVGDNEFADDIKRIMEDPNRNKKLSALITNDRAGVHMIATDNRFTANILYRLGFSWPILDDDYLYKVIESLKTMGFFQ